MRVLIVEDEPYAFDKLALLLKRLMPDVEVVGHATSIKTAVEIIKKHPTIELAFFDIQLSDGLCFNIFDATECSFPVIFTTAYDNFAIRAFKHHSVDYLLKPIRPADLGEALQKYDRLWSNKKMAIGSIINPETTPFKNHKKRFTIQIGDHLKIIESKDIACFYSFNKGSFLLNSSNRNYLVDYTLDEIYQKISHKDFFKINRSAIIHINYIKKITKYGNSQLKIELQVPTDKDLIVSRERVKPFKFWIEHEGNSA